MWQLLQYPGGDDVPNYRRANVVRRCQRKFYVSCRGKRGRTLCNKLRLHGVVPPKRFFVRTQCTPFRKIIHRSASSFSSPTSVNVTSSRPCEARKSSKAFPVGISATHSMSSGAIFGPPNSSSISMSAALFMSKGECDALCCGRVRRMWVRQWVIVDVSTRSALPTAFVDAILFEDAVRCRV